MLTWRENLSTLRGHLEPDGPKWRETRAVDYVPGCALLARREVLEQVGMFDAEFFAYMEDVDLCLRARRAGFEVWLAGDAAVLHASSSATGGGYNPRRKYMMGVNSIWFLRRHARAGEWLRFVAVRRPEPARSSGCSGIFRGRGKAVRGEGARDPRRPARQARDRRGDPRGRGVAVVGRGCSLRAQPG